MDGRVITYSSFCASIDLNVSMPTDDDNFLHLECPTEDAKLC